jgi:peroxiredoxin
MKKPYSNRQMVTDDANRDDVVAFFFPKENPPVTINAHTLEEAEEKLAALNKKAA